MLKRGLNDCRIKKWNVENKKIFSTKNSLFHNFKSFPQIPHKHTKKNEQKNKERKHYAKN